MTYDKARDFVESTKQYGSILGLTNIRNLMAELDDVQDELHIIHVAGTNGKGSTSTMITSALMEAGRHVGRYSSPAVFHYREIFQVDGETITEQEYADCTMTVKMACEKLVREGKPHPTSFEVETAIAFLYFYQKKCDDVVLETGMGGETDATNIISRPACSVLTSISMDHMAYLGDTLGDIAGVKAGIIKEGCLAVTAPQQREALSRIRQTVVAKHAILIEADREQLLHVEYKTDGMTLIHRTLGELRMKMTGEYQLDNALCAITVLTTIQSELPELTDECIIQGLECASWPGRFEVISDRPLFIIDGAHNEAAAKSIRATVKHCFPGRKLTCIMGVLADKEYDKILAIMSEVIDRLYVVTPHNPRALEAKELAQKAETYCEHVSYIGDIAKTVQYVKNKAEAEDVILAFGSLSYLAEVKDEVSTF